MHKKKNLAAKIILPFLLSFNSGAVIASGIPVFDGANVTQSVISAMESVAQTARQIQQYQTQLRQYENQLRNSLSPDSYTWDQAQGTINNLLNSIDTLNYHKSQLGSMTKYLDQFQSADYYASQQCFGGGDCSVAAMKTLKAQREAVSLAQKTANDAALRGLEQQQQNIAADAARLEQLQSSAQGASGQLAAIGVANQLASHQANQLLQLRALLIAQQNAIVTRNQAVADKEAQLQSAKEQARMGDFVPSPVVNW